MDAVLYFLYIHIVRHPKAVYSLKGQIEHKISFISEHVPSNVTVILIGHSIGCYIIMHMLPRLTQRKIAHCYLLFPTVERMAESPNGRFFSPALKYFRWALLLAVSIVRYLGPSVHKRLTEYYLSECDIPSCAVSATLSVFHPTCFSNVTHMAR